MDSKDLHITDTGLIRQLNNTIVEGNKLNGTGETREELKDSLRLKVGEVLRFYPETDKALVHLNGGGNVRCLLTHMYFDGTMNISTMPMGAMGFDVTYNEQYIKPSSTVKVLVLDIEHGSNKDEYAIIGYINNTTSGRVTSNADAGELRLTVGDNVISIRNDSVSIESGYVYLNGMPLHLPKFDNIYEKTESDTITDGINDSLEDVNSTLLSRVSTLESRVQELEKLLVQNTSNSTSTPISTGANTEVSSKTVDVLLNTNLTTLQENNIRQGEYITTTITDKQGNTITDTTLEYHITRTSTGKTKTYNVKTDLDGTTRLQINLTPDQYTIEIIQPQNNKYNYRTTGEYNFTVIT